MTEERWSYSLYRYARKTFPKTAFPNSDYPPLGPGETRYHPLIPEIVKLEAELEAFQALLARECEKFQSGFLKQTIRDQFHKKRNLSQKQRKNLKRLRELYQKDTKRQIFKIPIQPEQNTQRQWSFRSFFCFSWSLAQAIQILKVKFLLCSEFLSLYFLSRSEIFDSLFCVCACIVFSFSIRN